VINHVKQAANRLVKAEIAHNRLPDDQTAKRELLVARKRFNEALGRISTTIQAIKASY
jgi:predicted RNA-binding protein with EMAP domain